MHIEWTINGRLGDIDVIISFRKILNYYLEVEIRK